MPEASKGISFKEIFDIIKPAKNLTKLLSLGFGIILIGWLLSQLELSETLKVIRNVPISLVVLGFCCYALSFFLRAIRFKLLLPREKPVQHLFPIVLLHYTALNIIPARLGELSYVYLLKKIHNISAGYSISSLIIARIFDQIAISLLFLLSSLFVDLPTQWLKMLNLVVAGLLIMIFVALMIVLAHKEHFVNWIKMLVSRWNLDRYRLLQHIMHAMDEVVIAFRNIQITQHVEKVFGLSILIWIGIFSVNYLLLKAFDVHLSFVEIVLASTFIILLTVLPFQLLSGLGIHETTWRFIAVSLGVSNQIAIISAFGTHILSTMFLLIFAAYGLWKVSTIKQDSDMRSED